MGKNTTVLKPKHTRKQNACSHRARKQYENSSSVWKTYLCHASRPDCFSTVSLIRRASVSTVPWGTRERVELRFCERFWTCGPLLSRSRTIEHVSWLKEEPPSL